MKITVLRQLLFVSIITTILSIACRKNDGHAPASDKNAENEAAFFTTYSPQTPVVQAVWHFTKNQNEQYQFAGKYLRQIGKPRWDKALVYEGRSAARAGTPGADSTVVYIPFARDTQRYVNASLIVKMKPGDTTFRMLYDWQYKEVGFSEQASGGFWNAATMMQMYMLMDQQVFGTDQYRIKDSRLLPESLENQIRQNNISLDSIEVVGTIKNEAAPKWKNIDAQSMIYGYCLTTIYCVQSPKSIKAFRGADGAMSTTPDMICSSSSQCYVSYPDFGGGGGGGGTTVNQGSGGGINGGGGGAGWTNPNPVPVDCAKETSYSIGKDIPCIRGWEPVNEIQNNISDPCLKKMVDQVINKNLNNRITKFVNSVFATSDKFDLHFFDGYLTGDQSHDDAYAATSMSSIGVLKTIVKLNLAQIGSASEEYVAATIIHEIIHGWINYTYPTSSPSNREQHELMANTDRFSLMQDILRSMYPNLSLTEAADLTWGGLYSTVKFNSLPIVDRERIAATNEAYKKNNKGTPCTP